MKKLFGGFLTEKSNRRTGLVAGLLIMCLFLGTFFAPFSGTEAVEAEQGQVVRVAVFPISGVMDYDLTTDTCSGLIPKMLAKICSYTNWKIQYVYCGSRREALNALAKDQADLVPAIQKSESLSASYIYADMATGYTYNALMCLDQSDLKYEDYEAFDGIRIGMEKDYLSEDLLYDYLLGNGVDTYYVEKFDTIDEAKAAMQAGKIDAIASNFLDMESNLRAIAYFNPRPYFFVTTRDKQELADELILAVTQLNMDYPGFITGLSADFYDKMTYDPHTLTPAEIDFLTETQELTVGYLGDQFPYSYMEDGEFEGIARDVLNEYAESTDIHLTYVRVDSCGAGVKALQDGEIDILAYYTEANSNPINNNTRYAKNYAEINYALIIRQNNSGDIKTVGLPKAYAKIANETEEDYDFTYYDSVRDCLDAVKRGDVDACAVPSYQFEKLKYSSSGYSTLAMTGNIGDSDDVYFLVSNKADESLAATIRKLTDTVDDASASQYIVEHVQKNSLIFQRLFWIVMLLLVLGVLVAIYINLKYRNSERIRTLTSIDQELGIWNSSYFRYHAVEHVKHDGKQKYAVVYLYLSLLRTYYSINGFDDCHAILEIVVKNLQQKVIDHDTEHYARGYGGRFILLLQVESEEKFEKRLENIRRNLNDDIAEYDSSPMPICFGVDYVDIWTHNVPLAMDHANTAIDSIKNSELPQTIFYTEEFDRDLKARYEQEKNLDQASLRTDFLVYFQSKVDVRTEEIVGAEALVRMIDRNDGDKIKSPYYFVDYYEHNGRIRKIDFFVLNEVCRMLKKRIDAGQKVVPISCNFSRLHFINPKFPDQLRIVVDSYGIPRELIEVEVTETALVEGFASGITAQIMDKIVELGFRLSVDDFGTGYSSLGVLDMIPASVIKLDRSFFRSETNRERKIAILRNFVKMARELDVSVVCEGVEFDEDVELMEQIKAYVAQGYRYSKPEPMDNFEARL